jgi:hypothetical protein
MTKPTKQTLAYSLQEFAEQTGMGLRKVHYAIQDGRLKPTYWDSKPLITADEGKRFLESLPSEKPDAA